MENSTSTLNLQMRAYFGQLDGFDEGSQWAGHVEEFNKKTQWTIVFSLTQVEEFSQIWVQEVQDSEDNCFLSDRLKSFHQLEMFLSLSSSKSSFLENSFGNFTQFKI